jgi:carbon storage regulator
MMQILIRHLGETLCIGDDIEVTVLAIKGDEVRLGVNAPKSVQAQRKETSNKKE